MSLKLATPAATVCVSVPDTVPPPGFVPIATVTAVVLSLVTTFPNGSSIDTRTAGAIGEPAATVVGCVVNTNCDAAAAITLNELPLAGRYGCPAVPVESDAESE